MKRNQNMTEGKPFNILVRFAIPILVGDLLQNCYSLVDTIIVGRLLGPNALAAVGNTGPLSFLVLGFVLGMTEGFALVTAQAFGSKDSERLKSSIAMNIMLNAASIVLFTTFSILMSKPVLVLMNTPDEVIGLSHKYICTIYAGIGASILYNGSACILRAIGDSKRPLYFLIVSSVLNIILDIVFIKFLKLGVQGAALATVIAQTVSGTLEVITIIVKYPELHIKRKHFKWNSAFAFEHLKIGVPMAFQYSVTAVGVIILQGALNTFGAVKMAAYAAASKVDQLITAAGSGFGVVMANYTGQNFGAKRIDRIKKGVTAGTFITLTIAAISMTIAFVFPEQLTSLFIDKNLEVAPEIFASARQYLFICGLFFPVLNMIFVYRNVLQAMGKSLMPVLGGFFELFARTICAFTLPKVFGFSGICMAGPAAWLATEIPHCIVYFYTVNKIEKQMKLEQASGSASAEISAPQN